MTFIDSQGPLEEALAEALEAPEYALDTEFHRERTYYPNLALVQLAWGERLVLVDPYAVDLAPLRRLLEGPGLAVVHAADQDLEVLDVVVGAMPARLFDTQVAAGFLGMSTPSLTTLVEKVLERRLPKGDRLTDWTRRPLTTEQLSYAASDVEHLAAVRAYLVKELEARGRLAWAEQECDALLHRPRGAPDPATAWWKLKETRQLRGKARGIAQELAAWRERRAAELDTPPRFVLPDIALASMANRPPTSVAQLRDVRGMDGRYLKGEAADDILEAVRRGEQLTSSQLRLPPTDELDRGLRPAVTLVSAWVAQLASDLEIDAGLLATRADLHAFLRREPDARLTMGWRHGLVGEPVRLLVEGEAALAFAGNGKLALEARSHQPASP